MALRFVERYGGAPGSKAQPGGPAVATGHSPEQAQAGRTGAAPSIANLPEPECVPTVSGQLPRLTVQDLARMDTSQLEARADAVAARVYQLESSGLAEGLAEYKGLRAELRWVARHRPEALALHGMTAELATAGTLVTEIPCGSVTDAYGRPIAYQTLAWPKAPAVDKARYEEWF